MMALAVVLLLAALAALLMLQPKRVIYLRLLSVPALCILFVLCLIFFSNTALKAAFYGLKLWAGVVVPSLFPFFVAADLINSTGFIRAAGLLLEPFMRPFFNVPGSGSFPLAMGITSGYPVGAKITCDYRTRNILTNIEAERLMAYTNNSGPLFIVGAVGTGMYGSAKLGIFFYICHLMACLTVGFLFRFYKAGPKGLRRQKNRTLRTSSLRAFRNKLVNDYASNKYDFGTILGEAIKNSVSTILSIGGFIVLFSVIIQLLTQTGIIDAIADAAAVALSPLGMEKQIIRGVLSGLFEITTGSGQISSATGIPLVQQLPAASLVVGWGGLSVHFQVMSIASKTDLRIRPYLLGKLLQGILAAFYTWLGLQCFRIDQLAVGTVLSYRPVTLSGFLFTLGNSLFILSVLLVIFTVFTALGQSMYKSKG